MAENNTRTNPYIGPRAFLIGEKLYGRDRELRELLNFLLSQRIVLLYSPSGAGKTSLVQAGLIPCLDSRGFSILPVIRVNLEATPPQISEPPENQSDLPAFNRYVYSAMLSLEEGLPEEQQTPAEALSKLTFEEYLEQRPRQVPAAEGENPEVEVLIFDQFEEILTIDPTDLASKAAFFSQVGDALRDRHRWALFSMREDFIAALDPYLRPIPTHLNSRYRLDLLGVEAARQAILRPVRDIGVDFTEGAAMRLVDDLRRVQVQRPDGSSEAQPGPYVEPVQLQVVCKRLWQNLNPDDQQISEEDVSNIGDVNQSLREYYADEVVAIAAQSAVPERAIREWVDRWLITEQGFRGQVLMSPERSEGLDNRAIGLLENAHLVRAEKRRGATWFELAHDRLIEPVRQDNASWLQENLSHLQHQAALWNDEGRPEGLLISGQALTADQEWATRNAEVLTPTEREFLQACEIATRRAKREKTTNRVIRFLAVGALMAAVLAIFFGARTLQANQIISKNAEANATLAAFNAMMASDNARMAETSQANALTAQLASTQAYHQQIAAQAAEATAQAARQIAEQLQTEAQDNAALANRNASIAISRQLAAQAIGSMAEKPDLASLLAIEAYLAFDTFEARDALLRGLQQQAGGAVHEYASFPPDINDITGVSISSDGKHIAWGTSAGAIVVWNYRPPEFTLRADSGDAGRITSLDWSPDGLTIAYATGNGSIYQLDLQGTHKQMFSSHVRIPDLAFNPDGNQLAAAVGNSLIVWDLSTKAETRRTFSSSVESVDWSHDGRLLALGFADYSVQVIDRDSLEITRFFQAGQPTVLAKVSSPWQKQVSVAWEPDSTNNRLLAIANRAGTVYLLDTVSGKSIVEETGEQIYNISFASDGSMVATAGESEFITLWQIPDLTQIAEVSKHNRMVVDLDFSPISGDALFASAGYDNLVGLFQLARQQSLVKLVSKSEGKVIGVRTSQDGSAQAVNLNIANLKIGSYTLKREPVSYAVSSLGSLLALGYEDGSVEILDLETETIVGSLQAASNPILALVFPKADELAFSWCEEQGLSTAQHALCEQNSIGLLDIKSGNIEKVPQEHTNFIRALAFDPNLALIASGGDDRSIRIWSLRAGQLVGMPLTGQGGGTTHLAFSPDGRMLASASDDQTVLLWDMTTNRPVGGPFTGFSGEVTSLAFAPDGLALYTGLADGSLQRWDIDPHSWIERNCEAAGRSLTETEWSQFYPPDTYTKRCPQNQ